MSSEQATINVRINASLKDRGDKILHDYGLSTSEVIRSLWGFLARTRELPSFLTDTFNAQENDVKTRKREALNGLAGITKVGPTMTDNELDSLRFQSMLQDYEALS